MKTFVIAEVGCNHRGDLETALEMVRIAATTAKVDAVKFQKRCNQELLTPEEYNRPHPNPAFAYGPSYGLHREALEFTPEEHRILAQACTELGVEYSTSVWDLTSAREMADVSPGWLKVPSACNLNKPLLSVLADSFGGKIHLSLGMTTRAQEEQIVQFFEDKGRASDLVLYACTSDYPVDFDDICLLEIPRLVEAYGSSVAGIGFSGHHLGIAADIGALTLGARFFERHFTLDRTWRGTDHAASLETPGLTKLTRDIRNVSRALTEKPQDILAVEEPALSKLKQGQVHWEDAPAARRPWLQLLKKGA